jgi:hypothetical protein
MITPEQQILLNAAQEAYKTPKWNTFTRVVKAGTSELFNVQGTFFYAKEATGPLLVAFDNGPDMPLDVGTGMESTRPGDVFQVVIFRNPFATDVTVTFWAGVGRFIDNRFTLVASRDFALNCMDAKTKTYGSATVSIANAGVITFSGTPAGTQIRRRSLTVSNLDPTARLQILDSSSNPCETIEPKTSQVIFSSGALKLSNTSGGAVSFNASEVWYDTTG